MQIQRIQTSNNYEGHFYIENNVWLFGDDEEVYIIDASHAADAIAKQVGGRQVRGIILTHGHNDHINAAPQLAEATGAKVYMHPADQFLWEETHGDSTPDRELADGRQFTLADSQFTVLHTPGHTPGSVCFAVAGEEVVFSGDTLFPGGPGATHWDYASHDDIINSIKTKLLVMPDETKVHPGHGDSTTIGAERDLYS